MVKPITVNKDGEKIERRQYDAFADEPKDTDELGSLCNHVGCGGWVDFDQRSSDKANFLNCRACNLRVAIPKRIKTFGGLRQVRVKR